MKRFILPVISILFCLQTYGQVEKIKTHLDSAFVNVKKAWEAAGNGLEEIQKCHLSTSLDDLQFNAVKAAKEFKSATLFAFIAETESDGAVGEASNIDCEKAGKEAASAIMNFKKSKDKFDDVFTNLNDAAEEEEVSILVDLLNSSISDIEKGMNYLKKGLEKLNEVNRQLSNCQ